jgi:hypothetical protein
MPVYQLAQLNIARMLAPIDSPVMAGFVARLNDVNALADKTPGFVWRLIGDGNDATSLRPFDDDMLIVNMSVWENMEALHQYTYYSGHVEVFRQRTDWFEKMTDAHMVLWWIPAGHIPTVQEAKDRLTYLNTHGATPYAFTFKQPFPPEDSPQTNE